MKTVPVAIITGTIGVGKSTVAALASEILHDRGIKHGLVEVDSLEGVYPPADPNDPYSTAFAMKNLAAIWPNFLDAGITRAIVTMTLENQQELDDLLVTMASPPATVVRLIASEHARKARIEAREFGNLRSLFLEKTSEIEHKMDGFGLDDISVVNEDRPPHETALEVLTTLGWLSD